MSDKKPVLLQVNVTANWGSTGKIAEQIGLLAMERGWESYIAYGRSINPSKSNLIKVGSQLEVYEHYVENVLFDNEGLASRRATNILVKEICRIQPDVIHLHNIHDHWLNYRILFEYLNTLDIPIIWTQHDCWAFTGGCGYYSIRGCSQWQHECHRCPANVKNPCQRLFEKTEKHFLVKKRLFTATKNLTLVPVSEWLTKEIEKSFLKEVPVHTILNGIDTKIFQHVDDIEQTLSRYGLLNKKYVLGVATIWSERKGFEDYCQLAPLMPEGVKIVLVGLNEKMQEKAKQYGIIGISRTDNIGELVALYNGAEIVMNLSYEETFGLTTVEGFACGTPGIVYNATASPELITPETGIIVEPGDVQGVGDAVSTILNKGKRYYSEACRMRAVECYDQRNAFAKYLKLYNLMINN